MKFHRYNHSSSDQNGINQKTLLASAKVRMRDGQIYIVESDIYSSKKPLFDTFSGRISSDGKLTIRLRVDYLFGNKNKEVDAYVKGTLPKLVPFGRHITLRGSRLWNVKKMNENVWLRLDITRLKS